MKEWFGREAISSLQVFGLHHNLMITVYLVGIVLLVIYAKKITKHPKVSNSLRWAFFIILVTSELSYQTWGYVNGFWNPSEFLPFQLCSIAGILTMVALATKNRKLIQIILFIGIVPSFLAVVTPVLFHGYPHFRFWQFFIHHIALSWASIFLVLTNPIKLTIRKTLESYFCLLCYAALVGFIINPLFGANFLFLATTPSANTPLSLLGSGFWYYFNLCVVGLVVFLGIFLVSKLFKRKKQI